jgi:hypothetical protein
MSKPFNHPTQLLAQESSTEFSHHDSFGLQNTNTSDSYIEAIERGPMDGGNDSTQGFLLSAYSFILLKPPLAYIKQCKALVTSKGHQHQ